MRGQDMSRRVANAMDAGDGILHLAPTWVPRRGLIPGKRMRLAEQDLYALGTHRGGIDERWIVSTTAADNGPDTTENEGLSYVVGTDGHRFLFRDALAEDGVAIVGRDMMEAWRGWPVLCKFFDNLGAIPLHLHHRQEHASLVGQQHKPEAYYFPPQMNSATNLFPYTFFGLEPGTTAADVIRCLERWDRGDNGILDLSRAYRLRPGTAWLIDPGILHAPGSLCTYEVQWGSDVGAQYQSMIDGRVNPRGALVKNVPVDKQHDLGFLLSLIDWEANVNPTFKQDHYLEPIAVGDTLAEGYEDLWVIYGLILGQDLFSARELRVQAGASVTVRDAGASGVIVVQGRGTLGPLSVEAPTSIRFGADTWDEFFISDERARGGFTVANTGHEPLVLLRYFGPGAGSTMPAVGAHRLL